MTLFARTGGQGPSLVLLHGWGLHGGVWAPVREALERRFTVTAIDLPGHGFSAFTPLRGFEEAVDEVAAGLSRIDKRVDGCLSHTSIVRYDAYEDAGGHQSASLAFLDAARSGVVVSAIQGRDYARIYVKELDRGRASVALSPEEQQAVDRAMTY